MSNDSNVNVVAERQIPEDARQLLTSIHLLEEEIELAERQGRLVTSDRLQTVADRLLRDYVRLCEQAEGVQPKPAGPRPLNSLAAFLRVLFGLPAVLYLLVREVLFGSDGELDYNSPSVEQDVEAVPVVAVPVAIPISEDELPVADLAPVLQLTYTPEPKPAKKRAARKPKAKKPVAKKSKARKPKAKVMAGAARTTGETLFRKVGRRYVAIEGNPAEGEPVYRKVGRRYRAA